MRQLAFVSLTALVATLAATTPAFSQAEDNPFGPWYLSEAERGWHFDLFAGIEREPSYAGSDEYEVEPDLGFRAFYRTEAGRRWYLSVGEVGAFQTVGETMAFGAILEFEEGRDDEEDSTLTGFDEVDETVELQAFFSRRFGNGHLGVVLQPDILGRGKGFVTFLGGGYDRTLSSERLRFSFDADLSWGDAEHMRTEFGVTPDESARTGLPAYRPGPALKSMSGGTAAEWTLTQRFSLLAGLEFEYYFGEAADSPLVELEGDRTTTEAALAFRYRFGKKGR